MFSLMLRNLPGERRLDFADRAGAGVEALQPAHDAENDYRMKIIRPPGDIVAYDVFP